MYHMRAKGVRSQRTEGVRAPSAGKMGWAAQGEGHVRQGAEDGVLRAAVPGLVPSVGAGKGDRRLMVRGVLCGASWELHVWVGARTVVRSVQGLWGPTLCSVVSRGFGAPHCALQRPGALGTAEPAF